MIIISKTAAGILIQRDDLDIEVDHFAIPSTLGLIITSLIDCGRIVGKARAEGYDAGLLQGYQQCQIEQAMSQRIAARQELDLVEAVVSAGLVRAA